jgi:hypothetical protein
LAMLRGLVSRVATARCEGVLEFVEVGTRVGVAVRGVAVTDRAIGVGVFESDAERVCSEARFEAATRLSVDDAGAADTMLFGWVGSKTVIPITRAATIVARATPWCRRTAFTLPDRKHRLAQSRYPAEAVSDRY